MDKKLPTIKEIAKQLNISASTVSRALHNHPSIGLRTKTRVNELAKQLNYEPNQTAIFFKQGKTFTIGVILPELAESFFSMAISGIEDFAGSSNYNVLLGQSHDDEERERRIVETMKNHRVDGMLVSVSKNTSRYDHFTSLKNYNIPIVFFDRVPAIGDIHCVSCRLENGMIEAIGYLVKKGHRHIGLINGPETLLATKDRLQGYKQGLIKNRIKIDMRMVMHSDLSPECTRLAMQKLMSLKKVPTAIIAFNDYVALDAIQFAKRSGNGTNCPDFVSFANLPVCSYMENPPLASVEQFPYAQGQKATEILLRLLQEGPQSVPIQNIVFDPKLVINR